MPLPRPLALAALAAGRRVRAGRRRSTIGEGEQAAREILHHHELFIYVVAGTFEITVPGEDPVTVARGDAVLVRDGADRVVNVGRSTGRLLVVGVAVGDI